MLKTSMLISLMLFMLALAYTPAVAAEAGKANAGLMVSNLGAPPKWKQQGWERMSVSAPGFMSKTDKLQIPSFLMQIWANEITENDKKYVDENIGGHTGKSLLGQDGHAYAAALWSVYKESYRTVIVSMLDTAKHCEDDPGNFNSARIHSTCPIRVTVVQGQAIKSVDYREGCFLDSTYDSSPGTPRNGPDPAINASLTRYDRQAGVIELVAIRDNRSLPECAKRLAIPK